MRAVVRRTTGTGGLGTVRAHLRQPLQRTGYALTAAGAVTSALGLVYWVLAARLYPDEAVGAASALVSALLLASGASQLSMNAGLIRFLPGAGTHGRRLVTSVYAASAGLALVLGAATALLLPRWSGALGLVDGSGWVLAFAASCAVWSIFALQDSALTGLRRAGVVLVENGAYAVAKIGVLVALAATGTTSAIFVSWVVPAAVALVPVSVLLFRRLLPRHAADPVSEAAAPASRALIARFVAGNHLATLLNLTSITVLPIVVAAVEGAVRNAYFFAAWTIAAALQLLPLGLSSSLTGEVARDLRDLARHCRSVQRQVLGLLVAAAAALAVAAPYLLGLFGSPYADEASNTLRLLSLAAVPAGLVMVASAVARVLDRPRMVLALSAVQSIAGLGLGGGLLPSAGITGLAAGWLAGQCLAGAAAYALVLRPVLRSAAA